MFLAAPSLPLVRADELIATPSAAERPLSVGRCSFCHEGLLRGDLVEEGRGSRGIIWHHDGWGRSMMGERQVQRDARFDEFSSLVGGISCRRCRRQQ
jgi:hypothetical protein